MPEIDFYRYKELQIKTLRPANRLKLLWKMKTGCRIELACGKQIRYPSVPDLRLP